MVNGLAVQSVILILLIIRSIRVLSVIRIRRQMMGMEELTVMCTKIQLVWHVTLLVMREQRLITIVLISL